MNILADPLPESITVQGEEVPVKTDFRVWIRFTAIVQEYDLDHLTVSDYADMVERVSKCCLYKEREITHDLFPAIVSFFSGFTTGKPAKDGGKKTFDYSIDADAIYSSFAQAYGIRLAGMSMHWYEFRALFANLPEESPVGKLIRIRTMKENDVPKEKRTELRALKEAVALPVYRSYAEDDAVLANLRKALR